MRAKPRLFECRLNSLAPAEPKLELRWQPWLLQPGGDGHCASVCLPVAAFHGPEVLCSRNCAPLLRWPLY